MAKPRSVHIHEDGDALEIAIGWNRGGGYTAFGFGFVWLALLFLVILQSGDLSGLYVGIFHILFGLAMLYSGLCHIYNYTRFRVRDGILSVRQEPLPWWRGNRLIGVHEVDQLFVHEEKRVEDQEPIVIYTLHAVLVDGSRKQLLGKSSMTREQALLIEKKLEEHLGITDKKVAGEVPGKQHKSSPAGRREGRRSYADPILTRLYQALQGDTVPLDGKNWQVEQLVQIDWNRADSDRRLQLLAADGSRRQLYISQHKTFLHAFAEKPLREGAIRFRKEASPEHVQLRGVTYTRTYLQQGKIYEKSTDDYRWVQQWTYETADGTSQIRILNVAGILSMYLGETLHFDPLDERLELGQLPDEELEILRRNWRGKDFV